MFFISGGCSNHQAASELNFSPPVQTTLLFKSNQILSSKNGEKKERGDTNDIAMSESRIKTMLQPQLYFCCEVELFQNQTLEEFSFKPSSTCVEPCLGTHSVSFQDMRAYENKPSMGMS